MQEHPLLIVKAQARSCCGTVLGVIATFDRSAELLVKPISKQPQLKRPPLSSALPIDDPPFASVLVLYMQLPVRWPPLCLPPIRLPKLVGKAGILSVHVVACLPPLRWYWILSGLQPLQNPSSSILLIHRPHHPHLRYSNRC